MKKYSCDNIYDLLEVIAEPDKDVLIHSGLFGLGKNIDCTVEEIPRITTLAFESYFESLILMPTFNYDFFATRKASIVHDKSQTGDLTEYWRNIYHYRSFNPVFNFTANYDIFNNIERNPFDEDSTFNMLLNDNILQIFWGSPFRISCTFLIYCEYMTQQKHRFLKPFKGEMEVFNDMWVKEVFYHFCLPRSEKSKVDYSKCERKLINDNVLHVHKLGSGEVQWCSSEVLFNTVKKYLKEDPFLLLTEPPEKYWIWDEKEEKERENGRVSC